jgi:hypothetical protein
MKGSRCESYSIQESGGFVVVRRFEMSTSILKRQLITDAEGNPIGVILPMEEYLMIERSLPREGTPDIQTEKLNCMKHAANDTLFMADLNETMDSFSTVDSEWWEHET